MRISFFWLFNENMNTEQQRKCPMDEFLRQYTVFIEPKSEKSLMKFQINENSPGKSVGFE